MEKKERTSLKRLSSVFKKNILPVIFIIYVCVLCGFYYSYKMVIPKYKSVSTMLLTSNNVNQKVESVTQNDITLNKSLIATYGKILKSDKVLSKVITELNLNITTDELYNNVEIEEVKDTQIIKIGVINEDALKAQTIAETLDNAFIQEIKQLYKMNNISVVDMPSLETEPYNVHHALDVIMSFGIGIAVSFVMIYIIYLFDTTIKMEQDIEEFTNINVVGSIPFHKMKSKEELIVHKNGKSIVSEAFKTIRTNISYSKENEGSKSILFTSSNASEGKSWVTANMAVAYAYANKNVIIVDADMRKGRQHNIFGVTNWNGLSDCLKEIKNDEDYEVIKKYIKQTGVPKVHIMTIGVLPPNPSELLSSEKMITLVKMLKCVYDIVIIDGTPCNLVADSIPISRIVDSTIIITECRRTKIEDFKNVVKLIENAGGKIEGAILNKKETKGSEYEKGYYYGRIDEKAEIELENITVGELILNRKEYKEEKTKPITENKNDGQIELIIKKIEQIEDKILNIQKLNIDDYTKIVDDIRDIYEAEIDKNKLAESIKENIIKNEIIKKLEQNNIEISNSLKEKIEELDTSDLLDDILLKMDVLENKQNKLAKDVLEQTNLSTQSIVEERISRIVDKIDDLENKQNIKAKDVLEQANSATQSIVEEKINHIVDKMEDLENKQDAVAKKILEQSNIATQNIVKERVISLVEKINSIENKINERNIEQIVDTNEEKNEEESNKLLSSILSKIDDIIVNTSDAISNNNIEIMDKIEQNNEKTRSLLEEKIEFLSNKVSAIEQAIKEQEESMQDDEEAEIIQTKNNVIELKEVKKKQEELFIEYGDEIDSKELIDMAVGIYEISTDTNRRRVGTVRK